MKTESISLLVLVAFLLLLSGFFSGSEIAYANERENLLKRELEKKEKSKILELLLKPEKFLSVILILNNFVNISAASIVTYVVTKEFGEPAIFPSTVIFTALVILFAEILPKVWAVKNASDLTPFTLRVMLPVIAVLSPLVSIISAFVRKVTGQEGDIIFTGTRMFEEKEQEHMVEGVERLTSLTLRDIMIPKKQVVCFELDEKLESIIRKIRETKHTRYPVTDKGKVIGIALAKDIFLAYFENPNPNLRLSELKPSPIRPPKIAPPEKLVLDQLIDFKKWRTHLVCIVNEFGEFEGIVTLEDIIEEIVGDIKDEYDFEEPKFWKGKDAIYATGDCPIREINREYDLSIPEEFTTVHATIISKTGKVPEKGDRVSIDGWIFEVVETDGSKIKLARIVREEKRMKEIARQEAE